MNDCDGKSLECCTGGIVLVSILDLVQDLRRVSRSVEWSIDLDSGHVDDCDGKCLECRTGVCVVVSIPDLVEDLHCVRRRAQQHTDLRKWRGGNDNWSKPEHCQESEAA